MDASATWAGFKAGAGQLGKTIARTTKDVVRTVDDHAEQALIEANAKEVPGAVGQVAGGKVRDRARTAIEQRVAGEHAELAAQAGATAASFGTTVFGSVLGRVFAKTELGTIKQLAIAASQALEHGGSGAIAADLRDGSREIAKHVVK